jgi:succinate dehydrogenase / fumarate reductase membrane anchor subunit
MDIPTPNTSGPTPRTGETAWLWIIKVFTGPLLVLLLAVHLTVNHLVTETGLLTWADVVRYFDNPWIVFMEILFLATVVTHSLLGMRGILLDMNPSRAVLKVMDWVFCLFGCVAIVYGIWLALTIAAMNV